MARVLFLKRNKSRRDKPTEVARISAGQVISLLGKERRKEMQEVCYGS